ncbi:MAG TPA: chemotaxis response regulator protein-glutamate methylesterase [Rickettsiales bacterium]|nr:chemotaxis response regulator protein-glutamate methylesterase [Rickettsiales bacterium]
MNEAQQSSTNADSVVRIMIVDDSAIIRGLLTRAFNDVPEIEVVAVASNGAIALERIKNAAVDIILLDVEMPEMDGLEALPQLLQLSPRSRVIMVSTLTMRNAEISLRALELGASDYVTKPTSRGGDNETRQFYEELVRKIKALSGKFRSQPSRPSVAAEPAKNKPELAVVTPQMSVPVKYPAHPVKALAIGSSTGGPQALATLFKALSPRFPNVPIFITQHMPPTFTTILAHHISQYTGRPSVEGRDGDIVAPGSVYLAPGNFHMTAEKANGQVRIRLNQEPLINYCRPSVDPMLKSLVQIYGQGLLTVILTGMGSDGLGGAREVVAAGGTVIAQDERTSVVWGMPRAVTENKLCSAVLAIDDIAPYIVKACA